MSITAAQVKELRERTGAGMMECKKYLSQANGDINKAIDDMRKAGATKAAKKEGRIAAEGIIVISIADDLQRAAIVEVNCETDFVARGDQFKAFAQAVADVALAQTTNSIDELKNIELPNEGNTVETVRQQLVAKIGENIHVRRIELIESHGAIANYIHGDRIGVIVNINNGDSQLNKDIAMHIAASKPVVVKPDDVPAELIAKEKDIYSAQAATSGKPQDIIEKMVTGRIRKFLDEVSLVGQPFVKDPNKKVADILKASNAEVISFVRFEVGEGIEKQAVNFAEEVMQQVKGSD